MGEPFPFGDFSHNDGVRALRSRENATSSRPPPGPNGSRPAQREGPGLYQVVTFDDPLLLYPSVAIIW